MSDDRQQYEYSKTFMVDKGTADVTIVLDQPNSPNVVLDPECDSDGEVEDSIF